MGSTVVRNGQVNFQAYNYDRSGERVKTIDQSVSILESIAARHGLKVVVEE